MQTLRMSVAALLLIGASLPAASATEELSGDALVVQATIPRSGNWLAVGFDSVWTTVATKLIRIGMADNAITEFDVGASGFFRALVAGEGAVWLPDMNLSQIKKIDPATGDVLLEIPAKMLYVQSKLATGAGSIWVVTAGGGMEKTLSRFDATTGATEAEIALPSVGSNAEYAFGSVWVAGPEANAVFRIDPATNTVAETIALHQKPKQICADETSVWVLNTYDGFVDRIDGATGKVVASIDAGLIVPHDGDLACGGGYVWAHIAAGTAGEKMLDSVPVAQIDPATNTVLRKYVGGKGFGWDLRYGDGSIWMTGSSVFRVEPPR